MSGWMPLSILLVLIAFVSACGPQRFYPGPGLPDHRVALIDVSQPMIGPYSAKEPWTAAVVEIDGTKVVPSGVVVFSVLPGRHTLRIGVVFSRSVSNPLVLFPFIPQGFGVGYVTVHRYETTLSCDLQAGTRYKFTYAVSRTNEVWLGLEPYHIDRVCDSPHRPQRPTPVPTDSTGTCPWGTYYKTGAGCLKIGE